MLDSLAGQGKTLRREAAIGGGKRKAVGIESARQKRDVAQPQRTPPPAGPLKLYGEVNARGIGMKTHGLEDRTQCRLDLDRKGIGMKTHGLEDRTQCRLD